MYQLVVIYEQIFKLPSHAPKKGRQPAELIVGHIQHFQVWKTIKQHVIDGTDAVM